MNAITWRMGAASLAVGAGLLLARTTTAGPVQNKDVGNDPAWVLHLDCDALRPTAVGKFILAELDKPATRQKLDTFQSFVSLDPRKQIHGVTIYATTKEQSDGVLLVYADFDADRLTSIAENAKEHEAVKHGKHTIHSWLDENKAAKEGGSPKVNAAIHGSRVIFGQKTERIADALDVLDGKKPNLTASPAYARLGANAKSAVLVGAARKLDLPNDPGAAVLKQAKMFWLGAGETDGRVELALDLQTETEETAKQIETVARGLISLMALQSEKPESAKIAKGLTVQQNQTTVAAKLSLPGDDVVAMLKAKMGQSKKD